MTGWIQSIGQSTCVEREERWCYAIVRNIITKQTKQSILILQTILLLFNTMYFTYAIASVVITSSTRTTSSGTSSRSNSRGPCVSFGIGGKVLFSKGFGQQ